MESQLQNQNGDIYEQDINDSQLKNYDQKITNNGRVSKFYEL